MYIMFKISLDKIVNQIEQNIIVKILYCIFRKNGNSTN